MRCIHSFAAKIRCMTAGGLPGGCRVLPLGQISALCAVFLLGASVFAWGLQSRLSLYHESSEAHPIPAARLMQDGQASDKLAVSSDLIHKLSAPEMQPRTKEEVGHFSGMRYYRQAIHGPSPFAHLPAQSMYFRPPPASA